MICEGIELDAMNGCFLLEPFNNFIRSIVNDVDPALFSSWNYIVSLTRQGIDVIFMNIPDLLPKKPDSQIPQTYLLILTSTEAYLIVLKSYILDPIVAL